MCPHISDNDEEAIAALLGELREPPRSWVEAAQMLPQARAEISAIVERAQRDAEYRAEVLADLEGALRREGLNPAPPLVASLLAGVDRDSAS